MKYFEKYVSNTLAGTSNQSFFVNENENTIHTGRVFYKIFCGGKYSYSFLFSNIIDGSFRGERENLLCDSWDIVSMSAGICSEYNEASSESTKTEYKLTFGGFESKEVMPGEFFYTDPIELQLNSGDYICLEISFKGKMIPCHPESIIPTFVLEKGRWIASKNMPLAGMVGCSRAVKHRIGFLGDSITQGIGTEMNSYTHWNAVLAEKMGKDFSYWNLGIGCGRASDAASNGAWLFKAKQTDIITVCYGVNDIFAQHTAEQIKDDLFQIISKLKQAGKKIILQTVPPFDYNEAQREIWNDVNAYIKTVLSEYADMVFDNVKILRKDAEHDYMAKYGGHPNCIGCSLWAEALYEAVNLNREKLGL